MSRYEWESGTIKIPARQWRDFVKQILDVMGEYFDSGPRKTFELGDARIVLDNENQQVTWIVPENNHAREHAHDHLLARALFRALGNVKWTRGSGGVIVGNDEYNRDSREMGGGGNYEVAYYGPPRKRRRGRW
jgi:hypothetical protein